jgi:hypothetical protein
VTRAAPARGRPVRPAGLPWTGRTAGVLVVTVVVALASGAAGTDAQTRRAPARRPPAAPATKSGPIEMKCPAVLGSGVRTSRTFCDVITGTDPAEGIVIPLPSRSGPATLTFDAHNRHTYSESRTASGRA